MYVDSHSLKQMPRATRIRKNHTQADDYGRGDPNPFDGLFGPFVVEKTHDARIIAHVFAAKK